MNFTNEELERQVLSAMMMYDEERLTAFSIIPSVEVFQLEANKVIAKAIQAQQDAGARLLHPSQTLHHRSETAPHQGQRL